MAFDQAICNYESEIKFGSTIGSTSAHSSHDQYVESPFESPDLEVGRNLYGRVGSTAGKPKGVTAEHLCKVWSIDKEEADKTINCTTQLKQQDTDGHISRSFSTNDWML